MNSKALTTRFVKCGTAPAGKPVHFTAVITTDTVDRDGEVVVPQGMNSSDYEKNPVLLYEHDEKQPIGKMLSMKRNDRNIEAEFALAPRPENHVGEWIPDTIGSLMEFGALNAMSIGFLGVEARPATKADSMKYGEGLRRVYGKWKLLEVSVVSMPANQEAIVMAVRKGLVSSGAAKSLGVAVPDSIKVEPSPEPPMRVKRSIGVTVPSASWIPKAGSGCGTGAGGFQPGNTCGGEGGGGGGGGEGGGGGGSGRKPRGPKKPAAPATLPRAGQERKPYPDAPRDRASTEGWGQAPSTWVGLKPQTRLAPPFEPVTVDLPIGRSAGDDPFYDGREVDINRLMESPKGQRIFQEALGQMGYEALGEPDEKGDIKLRDYEGNTAKVNMTDLWEKIYANSPNETARTVNVTGWRVPSKSFRVTIGSRAKAIVRAEIRRARGQIYAD